MNKIQDYDEMNIIERRVSYLVGARLRQKDEIRLAVKKQDEIRRKHPAPEDWDSVSAIRKWREVQ